MKREKADTDVSAFLDANEDWELLAQSRRLIWKETREGDTMKRIWVILMAALLLAGCGAKEETGSPAGETELPESEYETATEQSVNGDPVYFLKPEWAEYDPSVERIWFTVENCSDAIMETGMEYQLETLSDNGAWYQVPFKENVGWNAILIMVQPGGEMALSCWLSLFDYDFSGGGTYRIVKKIGDEVCAGQFKLVKGAEISAQTPYGYAPLEELPEDYSPIQRTADGPDGIDLEAGVIFDGNGTYGVERVETFLEKTRLGIPCQLRTFQDYGEGAVMTIDVIYENNHFLWRMRQEDSVAEQRFAYIVTDGSAIYLANGADWHNTQSYNSNKAFLVPEGTCVDLIPGIEQDIAVRLVGNATRYQIWSADGVWSAGLSDLEFSTPTEFFVTWQRPGEGSWGSMHDLQNGDGLETEILSMDWRENNTLKLECAAQDGTVSVLCFDPETERFL